MNYEDRHHPCITLCQQFTAFHIFYQRDGVAIQKYLQIFRVIVENIEHYGGEFGNHPAILKHVIEKDGMIHGEDFDTLDANIKSIYKKRLGISFLLRHFSWVEIGRSIANWLPIYRIHTF